MWIIDGSSDKRVSFLSTDKKRMNECYVWPHMSTCGKYFSVHSRKTSQIPGVFRFFVTEWLLLQSHNAKTMRAQTSPKCWAPSLHRLLIKPLNGWTNQPFIHQSAVTVLPTDTHLKTHICCFASPLSDWHEIRPWSGCFFFFNFPPKNLSKVTAKVWSYDWTESYMWMLNELFMWTQTSSCWKWCWVKFSNVISFRLEVIFNVCLLSSWLICSKYR